jgi:hypothetical protein
MSRENSKIFTYAFCKSGALQFHSEQGVSTDPSKIVAMSQWPTPSTIMSLRGFLGLRGYYRKFIRGYGVIDAPLTVLLRKNAFKWSDDASKVFQALKHAVTHPPVLRLLDFTKPLTIECDASGLGIGAVLMQEGQPIAFMSQALKGKALFYSTYEKELLSLVSAVQKWRPYLLGQSFIIKTDQQSLKFLLEQKVGTATQQRWMSKLLGYDFTIEYKKGKENKVADALSRVFEDPGLPGLTCSLISFPNPDWLQELKLSYTTDPDTMILLQKLKDGSDIPKGYTMQQDLILKKGRLYIVKSSPFKRRILHYIHSNPQAGHSGYHKTVQRAKADFYWSGMRKDIRKLIKECSVCQASKVENIHPAGLLQPLPIPDQSWTDISMDFIEGLPISHGHSVILVVVDRLTKYGHFLSLSHPYTAITVANLFFTQVFKLHGLPQTIVSDRDAVFTSSFWKELFRLQGTTLSFSSTYHPQSDGQTEALNKCLEGYLRCYVGTKPTAWTLWLPMAEWWYNTNHHYSTGFTPFEALYEYPPPRLLSYVSGTTANAAVDNHLKSRQQITQLLKENLQKAQSRMEVYADKLRIEQSFKIGDWVYLHLQPYYQKSVALRRNLKLAPRFFGPFQIIQKVGSVAYKLALPPESKIHPVFHVSCLKKKLGQQVLPFPTMPPVDRNGELKPEPEAILERRMQKIGTRPATEVLV